MHTPVSSNSSVKEEDKEEIVVEISENVEVEEIQVMMSKRNTVIKIPKPKDEKKIVFHKMLLLNTDAENCLTRPPVFAWENEYRDMEEDKQVGFNIIL
jgi:hypothetical protein